MLPKSCMLILLRFTKEEGQNISRANQQEELCPSRSSATEPSRRNSHICRRFETGGSLSRRVSAACPSPDGSSAWASVKGGSEVAGDGRERGGNPAAFVFVPRPGRVHLQ
jgi:hypothetical protein